MNRKPLPTKPAKTPNPAAKARLMQAREMLAELFEPWGLHALQVLSLSNAVAGTLSAARAGVRAIGIAYAELAGIDDRHGVKQVDRLLSNSNIRVYQLQESWARQVVGNQDDIVVAMDWTDFSEDNQSTLYIALVTTKGRALPLFWRTLYKKDLKGKQTATELELLQQLHQSLPSSVKITVLADRGFAKPEIYETLEALGVDYVIRTRQDITVLKPSKERCAARELVLSGGRVYAQKDTKITLNERVIPLFLCVKAKAMKEPWVLLSSLAEKKPAEVVKLYGRRFTVEETFRDTKDLNFGMGLSATHIRSAQRRDRLLLLVTLAQALLTLLGEASERSGMDRYLKINTVKTRTMSLINQGQTWWRKLPLMTEERLTRLMTAFDEVLRENQFFAELLGLRSDFYAEK